MYWVRFRCPAFPGTSGTSPASAGLAALKFRRINIEKRIGTEIFVHFVRPTDALVDGFLNPLAADVLEKAHIGWDAVEVSHAGADGFGGLTVVIDDAIVRNDVIRIDTMAEKGNAALDGLAIAFVRMDDEF